MIIQSYPLAQKNPPIPHQFVYSNQYTVPSFSDRQHHPHMFLCHRSYSWISGGDHFLVKNPNVLAFGIIENGRSWLFSTKWGLCGH